MDYKLIHLSSNHQYRKDILIGCCLCIMCMRNDKISILVHPLMFNSLEIGLKDFTRITKNEFQR